MPTNDFYEFATSSVAYVESLADYLADVERTAGQQAGIARAELNNRALRQGSAMAAAIGSFMVARGYDALDDGDTATRAANFAAAVAALIQPSITSAVNAAKTDVLKKVFPVGSFYTSYNVNTNPASLLGFGTWSAVQGRFLLSASSAYPAGSTGGAASHAITVAELPSHSHTGSTASAGGHTHTATTASAGAHTHAISVASAGAHTHSGTAASAGAHTHTRGTMEITGSIVSTDYPEYFTYADQFSNSGALSITNYRTGQGNNPGSGGSDTGGYMGLSLQASRGWSGATSSNGAHTHTISTASAGAHVHNVSCASAGAHTHTMTVATNGAHTHTVTIGNTGGGLAMSLLPPYVAVYMWRRTA
jgi:hypothetical protein